MIKYRFVLYRHDNDTGHPRQHLRTSSEEVSAARQGVGSKFIC